MYLFWVLILRIWILIRMQALVNLNPDAGFDEPESEYRLWGTWIQLQALVNLNLDADFCESVPG